MKKIVYILLIIVGYVVLLAACAGSHGAADTYQLHEKIHELEGDIHELQDEILRMKIGIGEGLSALHSELNTACGGTTEWHADLWKEIRAYLGTIW